jgi:hypothetical protein
MSDLFCGAELIRSLSATFLRNNIIAALRASGESSTAQAAANVGNNFVYSNPVLAGMARAIASLLTGDRIEIDPTVAIRKMINSYSWDMPSLNTENKIRPNSEVVLLTGSTGGLGSQLLASLIADDQVKKIYALNRPSSKKTTLARHESTFEDRRVTWFSTSYSKSWFESTCTEPSTILSLHPPSWYFSTAKRLITFSVSLLHCMRR